MKIIADKEKPGTFVADFIYHDKREENSSQRREKGDHRTEIPTGAPAPACGQDDEEERVSKISAEALPHRSGAHAAGKYAGDRKTEKLRPDRNGKYLCVCPSDCEKHFSDQEEKICVES